MSGGFDALVGTYPTVVVAGLGLTVGVLAIHAFATRRAPRAARRGPVARLVRIALLGCAVVLAATAFGSVLTQGTMHGPALLAHVMAGGAGTVVLALFALTWFRRGPGDGAAAKTALVATLLLGLATAGSMLASTFPWFGTAGLERLLDVHRFAGLGFVIALLVHARLTRGAPHPRDGA